MPARRSKRRPRRSPGSSGHEEDVMTVRQTYQVSGMTCGHCVQAVTAELGRLPGGRDVRVDLATGAATVTSDATLPLDEVRGAVDEAGYGTAAAAGCAPGPSPCLE